MSNTRRAPGAKPAVESGPVDLDALIAEADKQPYSFTLGGEERTLPHIETLTYDQLIRAEDDFLGLVAEVTDDDTAGAIRVLPIFALEELLKRWFAHAGVEVGELLASLRS